MASSTSREPISVLFVCLGNICRSTMAEGVFRSLTAEPPYKGLISKIDSSGTGAYHISSPPDSRTMSTLRKNGISNYSHSARKISVKDFDEFDYVFAMDRSNLRDIEALRKRAGKVDAKAKVMLFGEFAGSVGGKSKRVEEVEDPYYGGDEGFDVAYEQCMRFGREFLRRVQSGEV